MRLSQVNNFNEQLQDAELWEERLSEVMHRVVWEEAEKISFEEDAQAQLRGIDLRIAKREWDEIQLKVRDNQYCCDDIFYETISIVAENKPGWVYKYDEQIVVYCWKNKANINFQDGVLLLINDDFRNWFNQNLENYEPKEAQSVDDETGETWTTLGRVVPKGDVPRRFIRTNFDPTLPQDVVTEQLQLDDL